MKQQDLRRFTAQITRPANTTAYTAGDIIADDTDDKVFVLGSLNSADSSQESTIVPKNNVGQSVMLKEVELILGAAPGTALTADVFFFASEPTLAADNGTPGFTDAEMQAALARVTLGASVAGGANAHATSGGISVPLVFPSGYDGRLWAAAVARSAWTPASGEIVQCNVKIDRV